MAYNFKRQIFGFMDMLRFVKLVPKRREIFAETPATPLPASYKVNETAKFLHPGKQFVKIDKITEHSSDVMSAIEQGIITKTTKERLAVLENEKEDIETKIAVEETRRQKTFNKEEIERFLRTEFKDDPQLYLQHILDRVVVYDDKIEIFYKYTNTIPDDSDNERRGYFSSRCKIKINKAKRSMQVLDITIDQTIHFEILYFVILRNYILI